jgi:hypothetical protein
MCGGLVEMFGADSLLSIMLLALLVIDLCRFLCGAEENGCELVGKVAGSDCGEEGESMWLALLVNDLSRFLCGAEENGGELVGKVAGSCGEGGNLCEFGEGGG